MNSKEEKDSLEQVFIGFGSNQGDSILICSQAIEMLGQQPQVHIREVSSFYKTEPIGVTEQNRFINGVLSCETDLQPEELLEITQHIENTFHRVRLQRWGPRTLDLDILFFGNQQLDLSWLTIPHPRLHERRFVLVPLVEIAPHWIHPRLGISVEALLKALPLTGQEVERMEIS